MGCSDLAIHNTRPIHSARKTLISRSLDAMSSHSFQAPSPACGQELGASDPRAVNAEAKVAPA